MLGLHFRGHFAILIPEMPISILGLNRKPDGQLERHELSFLSIDDVELTKPFNAQVTVTKLSHDLYEAQVEAELSVEVDCHRCLKHFSHSLQLDFNAIFADEPGDDEWLIDRNDIDITEPVRQEILFLMPGQIFCPNKCKGI